MSEEKRELIVRLRRGETRKGDRPVIEMWNDHPGLEFPVLRMLDVYKLFEVGIDPNKLEEGEELITRFYAYYTESDKLNKDGNPYRDVTRLEAIAPPKSTAHQALDAMVALLRQIDQRLAVTNGLLEALVEEGGGISVSYSREHNGSAVALTPEPEQPAAPAPEPQPKQADEPPVLSEDQARRRFGKQAGPAVRAKTIRAGLPGKLTAEVAAGALSWRDALATLEEAIEAGAQL
jgi:hypothetical protein